METQTKEARILLVIEAIRTSKKLSKYSTAKLYDILYTSLSNRIAGRTYRPDAIANRQKLSEVEEGVLIRYILDLDSRGFAPRLTSVEDIANLLLKSRGQDPVGTR
jgi:hypothetical protein